MIAEKMPRGYVYQGKVVQSVTDWIDPTYTGRYMGRRVMVTLYDPRTKSEVILYPLASKEVTR